MVGPLVPQELRMQEGLQAEIVVVWYECVAAIDALHQQYAPPEVWQPHQGHEGISWDCERTGQHMLYGHPVDRIDFFEIAQCEIWLQWDHKPGSWAQVVAMTPAASLNLPQGFPYRTLNMRLQHVDGIVQAT